MINNRIQAILKEEVNRLNHDIELIASENYPSQDILDLMGSHFSVKYSEGFPLSVSKQGRQFLSTLCMFVFLFVIASCTYNFIANISNLIFQIFKALKCIKFRTEFVVVKHIFFS